MNWNTDVLSSVFAVFLAPVTKWHFKCENSPLLLPSPLPLSTLEI